MFNLEKFQADFKAKKISEFTFYTTLVKELANVKEETSPQHFATAQSEKLDAIAFDRFINLTGEKDNFDCTLLIDTETGYLYSPKWFNTNNRTFQTIHDYEVFVSQQVISGFNDWELVDIATFINFDITERIKWFDSNNKNNIVIPSFYYCLFGSNDSDNYKSAIIKYEILNAITNTTYKDFDNRYMYLGIARSDIINKLSKNTKYECELSGEYFPKYADIENIALYNKNEAYPFILSERFADLEIWGNQFSAFSFIKFLVENDFDTSFLPKAPNLIPYVLEALQKQTGIQLHDNTITFPAAFFNPLSEVSKHQNFIGYCDFLLWKIEHYSHAHSEQVRKANSLYSQLSDLKTDNPLLVPIQQYLLQKFDFSLQNLEVKLLNFKAESIAFLEKIEAHNSLSDFSENTPRLDFNLLGETVTHLYNQQIEKVGRFTNEVDFLLQLLDKITAAFAASRTFITAQKEALRLDCEKEYVEEHFEPLFSEWQTEITALENHYLPLVKAYFLGTLSQEMTLQLFTLLAQYRAAVDIFFLKERIPLIQKYADNPKSAFLQKLETQQTLLKKGSQTVAAINQVIHTNPQHLAKKFLHNQAQALLSTRFAELTVFSQEANLALTLQTSLNELQQRNFETHLADVEQYGKELAQRNSDINSLMFKMQKDLERQSNAKSITGECE